MLRRTREKNSDHVEQDLEASELALGGEAYDDIERLPKELAPKMFKQFPYVRRPKFPNEKDPGKSLMLQMNGTLLSSCVFGVG